MHRAPQLFAFALLAVLSVPSLAAAESPMPGAPTPEPTSPDKHVGVGYKLGNGIGFMGADLLVNVVPHVSVDVQGSYLSMTTSDGQKATGYAFAPAVHGELFAGQRSTPYAAVGLQYAHLTLDGVVGSGLGGFANLGYEWKWQSGLGIQVGGGVQYLQKVEATNGVMTLTTGGKVNPNIEFGVRYMFL